MSTHSCNNALRCEKITILLIAPKRCSTLHSYACCQAIIIQHDNLVFITYEIQKKNRQSIHRRSQERGHCQEEGKDGDRAERSRCRSHEKGKDKDGAERGGCGSQEERQDGDGAPIEAKKEEKERMRLEGG